MAAKPRSKPGAGAARPDPAAEAAAASVATVASTATGAKGKAAAKDLADRLKDPAFQRDIEQAVRDLPPERAAELVAMLEASMRRRKLELFGYLAAAAIVVVGMVGALLLMGSAQEGSFVAWIFLIPLGLAGLVMWLVGKKARAGRAAAKAGAMPTTRRTKP